MRSLDHPSQSLRALANELGVSPSYLAQVENGRRPATQKASSRVLTNSGHAGIAVHHVFGYNSSLVGESSSGRTADSGSVSGGSNPSSPATSLIGAQVSGRTAGGKTKREGQRLPL